MCTLAKPFWATCWEMASGGHFLYRFVCWRDLPGPPAGRWPPQATSRKDLYVAGACGSVRECTGARGSVQKWTGDGGSVREREGSCGSVRAVHENAGIYYGSVRGNPGRSTKKIPQTFHQPIRMYMLKVIAVGVRRYSNLQGTRNDHH